VYLRFFLLAIAAAFVLGITGIEAQQAFAAPLTFQEGDVIVSVGSGLAKWFQPNGILVQDIDCTTSGGVATTGSAFDSDGNFYMTMFFANEVCKTEAKPWVHYGLTSTDLVDTSNSMQMREAFTIIQPKVAKLGLLLSKRAVKYKNIPAVGRTHGQHASIISFGLKFANWASEMSTHLERIAELKKRVLICKTPHFSCKKKTSYFQKCK